MGRFPVNPDFPSVIILPIQAQILFPLEGLQGPNTGDACYIDSTKNQKMTHNEVNNPKDVVHSGAWGPMIVF